MNKIKPPNKDEVMEWGYTGANPQRKTNKPFFTLLS
jgi:hypothetical protein